MSVATRNDFKNIIQTKAIIQDKRQICQKPDFIKKRKCNEVKIFDEGIMDDSVKVIKLEGGYETFKIGENTEHDEKRKCFDITVGSPRIALLSE